MDIMTLQGQEAFVSKFHIAAGGFANTTKNPISLAVVSFLRRIDRDKTYVVGFYLDHEYMEVFEELYGTVLIRPDYKSVGRIWTTTELEDWLRDFDNNVLVKPVTLCFFKQENDISEYDEAEIRDDVHIDDRLWVGVK